MKILQLVIFPLWGSGSGTYVRGLSKTLAANDRHKVAVVAPEKRKIKNVKLYTVKLPFNAAYTGHPEFKKCKLYHELGGDEFTEIYDAFFKTIIDAVEDFKPDIIHVHHVSFLTWIAKYIKNVYNINFIVTAHGTGLLSTTQNKQMFQAQTTEALAQAKRITAVSNDTRQWVKELHGHDFAHKMRTIPGGIVANDFPAQKDIKIINKKYKLKNKNVVFFSGKLTPLKGVSYLVKAAKDIDGYVFIAGAGTEATNLKKIAKDNGIKNVHFLGYMGKNRKKEFEEFYYRADVFVAPSVWDEPLGLVILEAMVCSTPVVVTRKGGIPLAVKDGYNGLFVKSRNSTDIAKKVNKILHKKQLKRRLGVNARKTVLEKFTWKKIAAKFTRIYKINKNGNGNGHKKKKR
jgi:glycosyltransferase involved in cell wall biosynthesis|tara:strand:+ start:747 stop:1952 length:1206 start_codon:yes stop_codon:yes gene_type:complete